MKEILVSVVLGSYNRRAFLETTLESVRANGQDFSYEIIVVDGGSTDGSLDYLKQQKDVITIIQHNHGEFRGTRIERRSWGYFMNLGFKAAQGKYILMISDDCLLIPGAIANGVEQFEQMLLEGQKVGAIAFYWRNWPEQKEYWVGLTFGDKMFVNHGLYLRSALEEVGWIDEDNYMFYHADSDLSLKLWQAGFTVADCPRSFVEHFAHANKSIRKENLGSQQDDWRNYLERWKNVFYDPIQLNMGKWIYLDHVDKAHTATTFPFLNRLAASNRYKYENFKKTRIKPVIKQIKHFWNTYIKRIIRRF